MLKDKNKKVWVSPELSVVEVVETAGGPNTAIAEGGLYHT